MNERLLLGEMHDMFHPFIHSPFQKTFPELLGAGKGMFWEEHRHEIAPIPDTAGPGQGGWGLGGWSPSDEFHLEVRLMRSYSLRPLCEICAPETIVALKHGLRRQHQATLRLQNPWTWSCLCCRLVHTLGANASKLKVCLVFKAS